ncbi:unnamed protein product [Lepeophtheirus salmonis]|uniref:(salmon louse) hypothetical protein n=1 Tax=Lepeophtheirus salmonis TaxID=72036 RepID=A0A7R8CGM2_LEPSM|nr:unnamed protein product [Lepeophtheirus salmonis]CAF2811239.1 unnamed protein product [Lepeophtheirus salmonis]
MLFVANELRLDVDLNYQIQIEQFDKVAQHSLVIIGREGIMSASKLIRHANSIRAFRSFNSTSKIFTTMSTSHMEITAHNKRHSEMRPVRITGIEQLSPTVKGFTMELIERSTKHPYGSFLPGQWMDLYIPKIEQTGGYSMCSKPSKFEQHGVLDLAIKYSTWAPALWMHTQAQVNDELQLRFGGDYHYPNVKIESNVQHRLVLLAGGIGINPLASIYFDVFEKNLPNVSTHLLYSAQNERRTHFYEGFQLNCER